MLRSLLFVAALAAPLTTAANSLEIDEVVVTATRRAISSDLVSSGLTVVSQEEIEAEKLITDALDSNVGVFLQQTTPGQGAAIIRGLKGSSILHLVDGMRLNNAIFRSAPTQYFALVPVGAIERIELLRGTPTSLYGNDAVGGVVQAVTYVPRFDSAEQQLRGALFTSFDSAELGKSLRGTLDFGTSTLASSVSAEYLEAGDRRTGSGERIGPSGYESRAARWVLSGTPDDNRSWLFDVHYLEQPKTPRVDELVPGFGQTEPSSSEFYFEPNRRTFVHGKYSVAEGWGGLDWTGDVSWQRIDDDRTSRDYLATDRRRESNSSDLFGLTLNASRVSDIGSWIIGAEFYDDKVRSERSEEDLLTGVVQARASRFPDGSTVQQFALFANSQRQVNDRNNISVGVRATNDQVKLPQTAVSAAADISNTDVSGDLGWIFDLNDRWQLLANIGLGFRAPNVFDLGTFGDRPGNRFNIPNTTLESERVAQLDIGGRYQSEKLRFELMLYALDYDNRITSVGTGLTTPTGRDIVQSINAAQTKIHGVETALDFQVSDALSLHAMLNYTWGEQQVRGELAEPAGRIPPLNGRVTVEYVTGRDYLLSAWARFADAQDRLSARDVRDVRIDPDGTAGWGIVGLSAQREFSQNWWISLTLENLLDKRYRNHGSGLDAPGQNVVFSARYEW